jgi:hypothetical protein
MERNANDTMSRVGSGTYSRYTQSNTLNGRDARVMANIGAQVAPRFRLARGKLVITGIGGFLISIPLTKRFFQYALVG